MIAPAPSLAWETVEWAVRSQAFAGQRESGDLHVLAPRASGMLVGAIDGLGHGPEAAHAARTAATFIEAHAEQDLGRLIAMCHEELRSTRGIVVSVAVLDAARDAVSWLGVGNVTAMLFHQHERTGPSRIGLVPRNGVVGYRLPTLREATLPITRGDMLIFATDGIRSDFCAESPLDRSPDEVAAHIIRTYGSTADDALVLVVRYRGRPS